jgi:single-stranded-DNA-specific exonuclease
MIGTVADVMPLRGENRTLVHVGLQALRRLGPSPLAELRDRIAPEAGPLTAVDVAFRIVPRLNAAGRLASPALALKALEEGGEALDVLDRLNTERQAATQTAVDRLVMDPAADALPIAVSLSADYHPGIIGLIAARLTDVTGKPSLVGSMRDGLCTASLRSPEAYHLAEGLQTCASLFLRFGGHARAAGCTFALHQAQAVVEALAADVSAKTTPEQRLPLKRADLTLSVDQLTVQARAMLDAFEPCGAGNEEPLLHVPGVCLSGVRAVGREGLHLQAKVGACKLIAFRQGRLADQLQGETVDILARLRRDEWGGQVGVQLVVEDLRATLHPHG